MELNEAEKRQLFQVDGDCQAKVLDELYMTARFTRNPEQRDMVRGLMAKLRVLSYTVHPALWPGSRRQPETTAFFLLR